MNSFTNQITNYLWNQSWQIVLLVLIIAAVTYMLKNKNAHIRYLLWLILVAKCICPPLLTIPLPVLPQNDLPEPAVTQPTQAQNIIITTDSLPVANNYQPPVAIGPKKQSRFEKLAEISISSWLVIIWATAVSSFLIIALFKAARTQRWLIKNRQQLPTGFQNYVNDFTKGIPITNKPNTWIIDSIGQPFVWGVFKGSIYLPKSFTSISDSNQKNAILAHELSHVVRFDALVNLLQIIAQSLFWFHPFVWWANIKIRAEREKCCDEMAIARLGTKPKEYSTAIVNTLIAEHRAAFSLPSLAIAGPAKNIEDRIKTIMSPNKKFYKQPSFITIVATLLIALIAVPTTLALTSKAQNTENVSAGVSETNDKSDPQAIEIVEKVLARYAELKTYSSSGQVLTDMDMSNMDISALPGMDEEQLKKIKEDDEFKNALKTPQKIMHSFIIKLAKPNLYCIEWNQEVNGILSIKGAAWSAGGEHTVIVAGNKFTPPTLELALATATGVSGGAANTIPTIFFSTDTNAIKKIKSWSLTGEEKINAQPCYILSGKMPPIKLKLWISKNSHLIIKSQQIFGQGDDLEMPEFQDEQIIEALEALSQEATPEKIEEFKKTMKMALSAFSTMEGTITETHKSIEVDNPLDKTQFIPEDADELENSAKHLTLPVPELVETNIDDNVKKEQTQKSAKNLKHLVLAVLMYADDHNGKLPDSLNQLRLYIDDSNIFGWALENVEYLGKGKSIQSDPGVVLAYDKTLLQTEQDINYQGTNVAFNDGHVEFVHADRLKDFDIIIYQILIEARIFTVTADNNDINEFLDEIAGAANMPPDTNSLILNNRQCEQLIELINTAPNAIPKVLVYDGQSATVKVATTVPYVCDVDENDLDPNGNPKPIIANTDIGTIFNIAAELRKNEKILLEFMLEHSEIMGYEETTFREKYTYTIPTISKTQISSKALTPSGQTLLIKTKPIKDKQLLILIKAERAGGI